MSDVLGAELGDATTQYPAMKDSRAAWLGRIPARWALQRMKTVLRERVAKGFADEPLLAATQSKGVVRKDRYENRTVLALKDLDLLKLVREGDFVISLRSFQGGIEYARQRGIISPAYTVLYANAPRMHGYLAWLFKSKPFIENLSLHVTGIRQGQNVDYQKLGRSKIPVPPASEQAAIPRFLQSSDRRIRRYISAKQKLLTLMEEQKLTIIHRAVTRGLDTNAKLSPTGVQWLGAVPKHWAVGALRFRYHQCLGKMVDSKKATGADLVPYLRNVDVQWDRVNTVDLPQIDIRPEEYDRYTVASGDLLVCEGRHLGRAAFWRGELAVCGFQKALHRLRPLNPARDVARWMYYCLYVVHMLDAFGASSDDSSIPHLTGEMLRAHKFPYPPCEEQQLLADYLDEKVEAIDDLRRGIQAEIDLLREYRTRLISDVVTGKLDVREAAAQLPEEVADAEPIDDIDAVAEEPDTEDDLGSVTAAAEA